MSSKKTSKLSQVDKGLLVIDNFLPDYKSYRDSIETRFKDPFDAKSERFVWDYWNVKDQYCLLRTPLEAIFSEDQCQNLLETLGVFAQQELGLMALSHPWVSAYTEGCFQDFHTDPNHGPWAFVLSLNPKDFFQNSKGGQTRILKSFTESNHAESLSRNAKERNDIFHSVSIEANQLCVFDPRRPHMVERVSGPTNILESRIVIHGWFTDPQPFLEGELADSALQETIDICLQQAEAFFEGHALSGCAVLKVARRGSEVSVHFGRHHLVDLETQLYLSDAWQEPMQQAISKELEAISFDDSQFELTLPIVYE